MSDILQFAIETAEAAGAVLRARYEGDVTVRAKSSAVDLVTDVDQEVEALILGRIRERYPDHRIFSEESVRDASVFAGDAPVWAVDPLDGTVNYAHGVPIFAVSLALLLGGRPALGVIVDPMRDETFTVERGQGAFVNGRRLCVSATDNLAEALLATGFPYSRATDPDNNLDAFTYLVPRTRGVRRAGSAALDLAWLAAGRFDAYWELGLEPYDWAAGWLLVEEAGGRVTDFGGRAWGIHAGPSRLAASNGRLHAALLAALREARQGSV